MSWLMDRRARLLALRGSVSKPRAIVVLATLAAIAAAITLAAGQARFEREQATIALVNENKARVFAFQQFVLRTLEAADIATKHLAQDMIAAQEPAAGVEERLQRDPTSSLGLFSSVLVKLPNRELLLKGEQHDLPPATLEALAGAAHSGSGELVVTRPLDVGNGKSLVAVVRPFEDRARGGYVAVLIEPSRFTDFAANVPFHDDDLISLIGLDGFTRARRSGSKQSSGEDVRNTLVMERQFREPNGTYLGPSVLDGVYRYFSHRRLGEYELFATSGTSLATLEDRLAPRRTLLFAVVTLAILTILGVGAAVLTAIERRQRRMNEIAAANVRLNEAQRIGGIGDWDYYPGEDRLHWSQNLRAMYGRSDDEAVSRLADIARYSSAGDISRVTGEIRCVLETGQSRCYEVNARMPDGSVSARRIVAAPVYGSEGEIIGVHGTDQDISNEVTLRNAEQRLQELARLDAMNALAATLAHELNQPLGSATNFLSAAKRRLRNGTTETAEELIEDALGQLHHLAEIIDSARDLVAHDAANVEMVSTSQTVIAVIQLLHSLQIRPGAKFEANVEPGAEEIWANVAQLKQVLFNLGKNGLEAVSADVVPEVVFSVRPDDAGWIFSVTDNGTGIPEGLDPFAALVSNKKEGLGIGLSLCRTIVEAHGGRIWVARSDRNGTTISFSIIRETETLDVEGASE